MTLFQVVGTVVMLATFTAAANPSINGLGRSGMIFKENSAQTDEFQAKTIDQSLWENTFDGWEGRAPGAHSTDNVEFASGELRLHTKYEPNYDYPTDVEDCQCTYQDYTTSVLKSKFTVIKGAFIQVKAKIPAANVLSNIFLQGENSEISIIEAAGASDTNSSSKFYSNSGAYCFTDTATTESSKQANLFDGVDLTADFNNFGFHWTYDDEFVYYLNGEEFNRVSATACNNEPHNLVFATEVVSAIGLPNKQGLADAGGATFAIKFVRSWIQDVPVITTPSPYLDETGCTSVPLTRFRKEENYKWKGFQKPTKVDDVETCAKLCLEEGLTPDGTQPACKSFEFKKKPPSCKTRSFTKYELDAGARQKSDKWDLYHLEEQMCKFIDTSGCASDHVDRFQVLEGKKYADDEPFANHFVDDAEACALKCAEMGFESDDKTPICNSFEYNGKSGECNTHKPATTGREIVSLKSTNLYNRTTFSCEVEDPTNCESEPIDRFAVTDNTKWKGFKDPTAMDSLEACAKWCVDQGLNAAGQPACLSFEFHKNKKKCALHTFSSGKSKTTAKWAIYKRTELLCNTSNVERANEKDSENPKFDGATDGDQTNDAAAETDAAAEESKQEKTRGKTNKQEKKGEKANKQGKSTLEQDLSTATSKSSDGATLMYAVFGAVLVAGVAAVVQKGRGIQRKHGYVVVE